MEVVEETGQSGVTKGALTFTIRTGKKPVSASDGPGGRLRQREGTYEEHLVDIHDGRAIADELSLDEQGFVLARGKTAVDDFFDDEQIRSIYYPEVEELVKRISGANRVHIFDHTVRSGDEAEAERRKLREPVTVVHNDYTEWSGPQRVRDLFSEEEAESLLSQRMAVIQVWRPIRRPVESAPLAICDARSLPFRDLIPAERRHADRVGEIYHVSFSPDHRWYYFPFMEPEEAIVFKCYDSLQDGRARFTAHGSFVDPNTPADAPPRESIEVRTLAFFGSTQP